MSDSLIVSFACCAIARARFAVADVISFNCTCRAARLRQISVPTSKAQTTTINAVIRNVSECCFATVRPQSIKLVLDWYMTLRQEPIALEEISRISWRSGRGWDE